MNLTQRARLSRTHVLDCRRCQRANPTRTRTRTRAYQRTDGTRCSARSRCSAPLPLPP